MLRDRGTAFLWRVVLPALLVGSGTGLGAEVALQRPQVVSLKAGLFCPGAPEEIHQAPDTYKGERHMIPGLHEALVVETFRIPMEYGATLGVIVELAPWFDYFDATMVLEHPAMGSDGRTRQVAEIPLVSGAANVHAYGLNHAYEMLPGLWRLSGQSGGMTIYEVVFEVVHPDSVPELAGLCRKDLLSAVPVRRQAG
ncbi:hypothetical protein AADZ90_004650 [Aestuariibius sp. 2305UL40-4]|uniref:hypothetical protein n=1 Tax=Aestuariibius violaceus TaxID=3234132 RepID=UPI00348B3A35